MEMSWYIDQVKFQLTGGVLETEIDDSGFTKIVDMALRELSRYYDSTKYIEVEGSSCIDLSKYPDINTVSNVFRTSGISGTTDSSYTDPQAISMWSLVTSGNGMYSPNSFMNMINYSTMQSISNTISTDLMFVQDIHDKKLYVNLGSGKASKLTLEYIPKLTDVSDVVSTYWIDILVRLSVAYAKITLGRIRTRYTQSGALWTQDGEKLLEEGNSELKELRDRLQSQYQSFYPVD